MNDLSLLFVFLLGTLALTYISRKSLFNPRAHGFYRYFAWELLLALFLFNVGGWFRNPLAWYQIISWVLLIIAAGLVIEGVRLLRIIGRQDARRSADLLGMERTANLVTVGLYRYIRHPLYSSLLLLAWGTFFKSPSWGDAVLALLCSGYLFATARFEERENIAYFGSQYREYMQKTKMFLPYLF